MLCLARIGRPWRALVVRPGTGCRLLASNGSNPVKTYYPEDEPPGPDPMCCMNMCKDCVLVDKYLRDSASNGSKSDPMKTSMDAFAALEAKLKKQKEKPKKPDSTPTPTPSPSKAD